MRRHGEPGYRPGHRMWPSGSAPCTEESQPRVHRLRLAPGSFDSTQVCRVPLKAGQPSVAELVWQLRESLNRVIAVETPTKDNPDTYLLDLAESAIGLFG